MRINVNPKQPPPRSTAHTEMLKKQYMSISLESLKEAISIKESIAPLEARLEKLCGGVVSTVVDYVPLLQSKKSRSKMSASARAKIGEYDPQIEVIIGFVRSKGNKLNFDCYWLKSNPAPPVAAEMG
ncbi:MAG: hypothetical protein WCD79_05195 [Chthoniobacteraceae bacterium]